jgi:spore coat polysaccharide biosynthesis protein SpsF
MKTNKTIAIITARMRSTRLKGKVLLPLYGKPALRWVADRCAMANIDGVVIATTADPSNDPIEEVLSDYLVFRYSGNENENDVIGRVLAAADWIGADIIVDVSGDCPLVDGRHIDHLLTMLIDDDLDYVSNVGERTWPDGCDIQTYRTEALVRVQKEFQPKTHTGWNILQHPETFSIANWAAPPHMYWPSLAITLDTVSDYELLSIIFNRFGCNPAFQVEKVIEWLEDNPHLLDINKHVKRKDPEKEA